MQTKAQIVKVAVLLLAVSLLAGCLHPKLTKQEVKDRIKVIGEGEVKVEDISGRKVDLKAVPDEAWQFVGWGADLKGENRTQTVTAAAGMTVQAEFTPASSIRDQDLLTVKQGGREVPVNDQQVTLDKKPFKLEIGFKKRVKALIYTSFTNQCYNKFQQDPDYEDISVNGGGSIALAKNSQKLVVTKNPTEGAEKFDLPSYYCLFHGSTESRFEEVKAVKDHLVGSKRFDTILVIDREREANLQFPIKELKQDKLYLNFVYPEQKKIDYLQINFN